jgi:hypothetical protein
LRGQELLTSGITKPQNPKLNWGKVTGMCRGRDREKRRTRGSGIWWSRAHCVTHEIFQAREYDAGASPTSSEHGASTNAFWTHDKLFKKKKLLKMDAPNVNVIVKERRTYRL